MTDEQFKYYFDQFSRSLYAICKAMLEDKQEAEDVCSEAFIQLFQEREIPINVKAWLILVAKNRCLDLLKHKKRVRVAHKELRYILPEHTNSVMHRIISANLVRLIYDEVDKLKHFEKKIFMLHFADGKSVEQIARMIGKSLSVVQEAKLEVVKRLRLRFSGDISGLLTDAKKEKIYLEYQATKSFGSARAIYAKVLCAKYGISEITLNEICGT